MLFIKTKHFTINEQVGDSATTLASKRQAVHRVFREILGVFPSKKFLHYSSWDGIFTTNLKWFSRRISNEPSNSILMVVILVYRYTKICFGRVSFFLQLQDCIPRWLSLTFIGNTWRNTYLSSFFLHICEHFRGFKVVGKG